MASIIKQRILVFLFPLFLSLPFLNRAYFVDDGYFVQIASWLKDHPLRPYHFHADDAGPQTRGWEENGFVRMVNPLAHHYYLALLMKIGGARVWVLRLGCVFLSCFGALFLFELARRFTNTPLPATLLALVTPVLWLTAHSLLIDGTMGALFLGGVYFFIRAIEKDSLFYYVVSGLFMGVAILAKYTALFALPLTVAWWLLRWKKLQRPWLAILTWVLALSFLIFYSVWTAHLYGRPHIVAASARMVHTFGWAKVVGFFVFFSGAFLVPLLVWGVISPKKCLFSALGVFILAVFFSSSLGGFSKLQSGLLGLWIVTSFLFVETFWSARPQWIFPRDHFLFLWVVGFVVMMLYVMDWVAVRYYVIVAPALVLMAVRLGEMKWRAAMERILTPFVLVVMIFTGALGYADYKQANAARRIGPLLEAHGIFGGERHFYLGDSFTLSYLGERGWKPCFRDTPVRRGDLVLGREVTMPLIWFAQRPIVWKQIAIVEFPTKFPLKVMDFQGSAGFYASVWGALPFTFSTGPWERFTLSEVVDVLDSDQKSAIISSPSI